MSEPPVPVLEARGIAKRFGPVIALRSADLQVVPGEVHALLGANGAGKSTLVKVLSGVLRPDSGSIAVSGAAIRPRSPEHLARLGLHSSSRIRPSFPTCPSRRTCD
jgi:ribose transport system ATP-binding protein